MCIDIVEIWLGIAMGKFRQILTEISSILTKLCTYIVLRRSGLGLLMGNFRQCLTELSARDKTMAGYYSLTLLLGFRLPEG